MSRLRTNIVTVGLFSAAALLPLSAAKAEQVGSASWYALTSRTASGEMMDPSAMTAAHPSLPFGTKVLVENLTNGQSVVVRITRHDSHSHLDLFGLRKIRLLFKI